MPFITGDIIASDDPEFPFKVIFKQGDTIVSEWLVTTREDGEAQMIEGLQSLAEEDEDPSA